VEHDLVFGSFLTPSAERPERVVDLARLTEQVGLDLVSIQDHPYQARFLDTWTLLSVIAARTSRITVTPNVANLPLRPPAVLARSVATLDLLSQGRVELGLGAGGFFEAIAAIGGPRLDARRAVDALEEGIRIVRAIWDVNGGTVRIDGQHYRVWGAHPGPAPAHDVGIWVGAYKKRMLGLTGRLADGWLPSSPYAPPDELPAMNRAIDAAAEEAGRDPAAIRRLYNIAGRFASRGEGFLQGPARMWADQLAELAIEQRFRGFIVMGDDPEVLRRFAGEVAPAVRELVAAERAEPGQPDPTPAPASNGPGSPTAAGSPTGADSAAAGPATSPGSPTSHASPDAAGSERAGASGAGASGAGASRAGASGAGSSAVTGSAAAGDSAAPSGAGAAVAGSGLPSASAAGSSAAVGSSGAGLPVDAAGSGAGADGSPRGRRRESLVAEGLGVVPTADDGVRLSGRQVWDETTRPTGPAPDPDRAYTAHERAAGRHLVDVHDGLRDELERMRDLIDQVTTGQTDPGAARDHISQMTIRQNNWTVGAYCESYCRIVTTHHTIEDRSVFPHLRGADPRLAPVIDRLEQEHGAIHGVLEQVDRALVAFVSGPDGDKQLREAADLLTDALLSHLAYEERELVEPLARLGFY
jgi:alkanesulfonate monooxygenase SsuD/methylene tetrahydromethanopterin reductase-like flavin-dependent oxidoreductase (luciferase family)